jgi:hypothetical protein
LESKTPKTPTSLPRFAPQCDPRLPQAALDFRLHNAPPLTTPKLLGGINVTAWLYRDQNGKIGVKVNPNTTIQELTQQFGPAETPDAEVGIHSEMKAGEWFRTKRQFQVLRIFTERIPCPIMCAPMLKHYFPGVPWYYYYDRRSWNGPNGGLVRYPADVLKSVYNL